MIKTIAINNGKIGSMCAFRVASAGMFLITSSPAFLKTAAVNIDVYSFSRMLDLPQNRVSIHGRMLH
jgi:hypothetical protein